ncbi:MAG: hypothetical protein AB7O43_05270 [Hyphomicrobiaceae bacterium]
MRIETRRKLDRALLKARLIKVGAVVAAVAATVAGLYFAGLDARTENHTVAGVIARLSPITGKNAYGGILADIKLASGGHVNVVVNRASHPHVGDRIKVVEHKHLTGRLTYTWR